MLQVKNVTILKKVVQYEKPKLIPPFVDVNLNRIFSSNLIDYVYLYYIMLVLHLLEG